MKYTFNLFFVFVLYFICQLRLNVVCAQCLTDTTSGEILYRRLNFSDFKRIKTVSDTDVFYLAYNFLVDANYDDTAYINKILHESNNAQSAVNIYADYKIKSDTFFYCIQSVFLQNEAYMIAKTKWTLFHEQIHWDIYELLARRLRRKFHDKINLISYSSINDSFTKWQWDAYNSYSRISGEYDSEVSLEMNDRKIYRHVAELKWKGEIDRQLNELTLYASPTGYVILRGK